MKYVCSTETESYTAKNAGTLTPAMTHDHSNIFFLNDKG